MPRSIAGNLSDTTVELSIYEDRLEVISPGRLPNGITPQRMITGCRSARNRLLKEVMKDYGYLEHMVAVSEVVFQQASAGARHIAAYRQWLNLEPFPTEVQVSSRRKRQHQATADDLDLSKSIELVALAVKERDARFDYSPQDAIRHYEVGLRIGELSLGNGFTE